ncbi:hypothetical protein EVAR_53129_1 [Eumeta japonica]|uniref:Uncharacterized protein n=1 Tax=Eumeta variegata TaxID=151549 RepID=A0A4C1Y6W6_EUMVA|nr:hypothetical protein EVAR_53129_1 [Eumeta japonica]
MRALIRPISCTSITLSRVSPPQLVGGRRKCGRRGGSSPIHHAPAARQNAPVESGAGVSPARRPVIYEGAGGALEPAAPWSAPGDVATPLPPRNRIPLG